MGLSPPVRVEGGAPPSGRPRLILTGRVTVADAHALHQAAETLAQGGHDVTVDCAAAEYLDTSAMQLLSALGRELEQVDRHCEIVGATARLREDFRLAGFAARVLR